MKFSLSSGLQIQSALTSILLIGLFITSASSAQTQVCQFPPLKELKSGSAVSTYVYHFWEFAQKNMDQIFKGSNYIQNANGQVVGDYHFKNLGAYYNTTQKRPQLAIIDLDDSGVANQFADLLKFLVFIKDEYKTDQFTMDAIKAYVSGLDPASGENLLPTHPSLDGKLESLSEILSDQLAPSVYEEFNRKYVLKKLSKDKKSLKKDKDLFAMDKLAKKLKEAKKDPEFVSIESKLAKQAQALGKILDRGFQINESGSSMNAIRFVYLVQTLTGPAIIELKELTCAGAVKFQPQKEQKSRFDENKMNLQSTPYWEGSHVISIGPHAFLFRTKVDNPIEDLLAHAKKDLKPWVMFYAYTLGRIHRQTAQSDYAIKLEQKAKDEKDLQKLAEKVNEFVSEYLKHLKASLK